MVSAMVVQWLYYFCLCPCSFALDGFCVGCMVALWLLLTSSVISSRCCLRWVIAGTEVEVPSMDNPHLPWRPFFQDWSGWGQSFASFALRNFVSVISVLPVHLALMFLILFWINRWSRSRPDIILARDRTLYESFVCSRTRYKCLVQKKKKRKKKVIFEVRVNLSVPFKPVSLCPSLC